MKVSYIEGVIKLESESSDDEAVLHQISRTPGTAEKGLRVLKFHPAVRPGPGPFWIELRPVAF